MLHFHFPFVHIWTGCLYGCFIKCLPHQQQIIPYKAVKVLNCYILFPGCVHTFGQFFTWSPEDCVEIHHPSTGDQNRIGRAPASKYRNSRGVLECPLNSDRRRCSSIVSNSLMSMSLMACQGEVASELRKHKKIESMLYNHLCFLGFSLQHIEAILTPPILPSR